MVKVIYSTLVMIGIILAFGLCNQNQKLKEGITIHK